MKSKISQLLEDIIKKKEELVVEYEKLRVKYNFDFIKWKIIFSKETKLRNKKFKESLVKYIFSAQIRHIISMPFIYMMVIPTVILDIFLIIYQNICFRLYGIPLVKRSEYVTFDRRFLDYLNIIQKFHCLYCSYVNGVYLFAVEVAWRTEKYWCPIKHAKKMWATHDWHQCFADYWDPEWFKKVFNKNHEFYEKVWTLDSKNT